MAGREHPGRCRMGRDLRQGACMRGKPQLLEGSMCAVLRTAAAGSLGSALGVRISTPRRRRSSPRQRSSVRNTRRPWRAWRCVNGGGGGGAMWSAGWVPAGRASAEAAARRCAAASIGRACMPCVPCHAKPMQAMRRTRVHACVHARPMHGAPRAAQRRWARRCAHPALGRDLVHVFLPLRQGVFDCTAIHVAVRLCSPRQEVVRQLAVAIGAQHSRGRLGEGVAGGRADCAHGRGIARGRCLRSHRRARRREPARGKGPGGRGRAQSAPVRRGRPWRGEIRPLPCQESRLAAFKDVSVSNGADGTPRGRAEAKVNPGVAPRSSQLIAITCSQLRMGSVRPPGASPHR